jgi:hypothetical protein
MDSGSHWLRPCSSDEECGGDGLSCLCGLCTQDCNATSACDAYGEAVACVAPDALTGTECGAGAPAGMCAATCEAPADCPDSNTFDCQTGLCTALVPPAVCAESDCGPAPGMPNTLCEDGVTMAGPTGRCLATPEGGCGWEITECPPPDDATGCTWEDCPDPAPGAPNFVCADGTLGGPACLPDPDTGCAWQIVECDPATGGGTDCTTEECGLAPGMPNWECADGTVAGPACMADADGVCGWQVLECPDGAAACDESACGPAPGMPNTLCPDGETVAGPTGRCLQTAEGTCGWEIVQCPE